MTDHGDGGFGSGVFGGHTGIEVTGTIVSDLPPWLGNGRGDGNWNLLEPVGSELAAIDYDVNRILSAAQLKNANTMDQLQEIGRMVNTFPNEGEALEKYRARVAANYALSTCEGTIDDVLTGTASMLDIEVENIGYSEPSGGEQGTAQVSLPNAALDNTQLTASETAEIIDKFAPAGYRIDALVKGTFTYITPDDYNNNNHDASKGYDGLDANSDPKDNGGTYAGLVN